MFDVNLIAPVCDILAAAAPAVDSVAPQVAETAHEVAAAVRSEPLHLGQISAAIGASIAVLGASYGISRIGVAAMEGIARQPEAANDLRASMVLAAVLIEGVGLFGVLVGLIALFA